MLVHVHSVTSSNLPSVRDTTTATIKLDNCWLLTNSGGICISQREATECRSCWTEYAEGETLVNISPSLKKQSVIEQSNSNKYTSQHVSWNLNQFQFRTIFITGGYIRIHRDRLETKWLNKKFKLFKNHCYIKYWEIIGVLGCYNELVLLKFSSDSGSS